MIEIAMAALFGAGVLAVMADSSDDDQVEATDASTDIPEDDAPAIPAPVPETPGSGTPSPVGETPAPTPEPPAPEPEPVPLIHVQPETGAGETYEASDLSPFQTGLLFDGDAQSETITVDPDTTENLTLDLSAGGTDTVVIPAGVDVDAVDTLAEGQADSPDHITLQFDGDLPGDIELSDDFLTDSGAVSDWPYEYTYQQGELKLDPTDTLHVDTGDDLGGSLLPIYLEQAITPGDASSSSGYEHSIRLYHVPEGVTPDLDALQNAGTPFLAGQEFMLNFFETLAIQHGLTPVAMIDLGEEGVIGDPAMEQPDIVFDDVMDPPAITSTLSILPQAEIVRDFS